MQDLLEIHTKSKGNDRGLKQEFREALAYNLEGMGQGESVKQPGQKRNGRRHHTTGCQNQPHKEEALVHATECGPARGHLSKH